jgi:hypothetical protein
VDDERTTLARSDGGEQRGHVGGDLLGLQRLVVDEPALTVRLHHERLLVVVGVDAETAGEATAPRALFTDSPMAGTRDHLVELLERFHGVGLDEPGTDHDVFVGERHQCSVIGLAHQPLQHLVALRTASHAEQAEQHTRRAADALEGGEA